MARERRVERIVSILEENGGRMRLRDLVGALAAAEENPDLFTSAVWVAMQNENERLDAEGKAARFVTSRNGEQRGWIRLQDAEGPEANEPEEASELIKKIRAENAKIDDKIKERLLDMTWQTFETSFLTVVLEKLGFQHVTVTQATRDGGVDARVAYQRGIVEARAIVSAKHWGLQTPVPVTEVRQLRGIRGDEDTAIIITTGRCTEDARHEAAPSQNQRIVYLIDGSRLVEVCKEHQLFVRRVTLPELLVLDEFELPGGDDEADIDESDDPEEASETSNEVSDEGKRRRLREEMLGDRSRGLSAEEIAKIVGLALGTVRNYLTIPERKRALFNRIRADGAAYSRALRIVERKRS